MNAAHDEIIKRDPILRLLRHQLKWSGTRIIIVASLVSGIILLVPGALANSIYGPEQVSQSGAYRRALRASQPID